MKKSKYLIQINSLFVVLSLCLHGCSSSSDEPKNAITGTPQIYPPVVNNTKVFTGAMSSHVCALPNSNQLYCWGNNESGQLGIGVTGHQYDATTPQAIDSTTQYQIVSLGSQHTCALTVAGQIKCWGANFQGQIGNGTQSPAVVNPTTIDLSTSYKFVTAGSEHSCGITTAGKLKCWGYNFRGELGDGTNNLSSIPISIDAGENYISVSAGQDFTCAVTANGQLKCWGDGAYRKLGTGNTANQSLPTNIDIGTKYVEVNVGGSHACALTESHQIKCWGRNSHGQVGNGLQNGADVSTPELIDASTQYVTIGVGYVHTCGLTQNQQIKCWGLNNIGQMGNNAVPVNNYLPGLVSGGGLYLKIAIASYSACALTTNNSLFCWGDNQNGQLGSGNKVDSPIPIAVLGI